MDVHVCGLQLVLSTCFVIPDCCICFVQFSFDFPILIYFCGLFGVDKFYINCSVHHCNCFNKITNTISLVDYPLFSRNISTRSRKQTPKQILDTQNLILHTRYVDDILVI